MRDNFPSIFDGDSFFSDGFSIFNTLLSQAQARMNELMEDPDTKVYKSPDGTTTICYNSKSSVDCLPPSRAKKTIIYNDYPITDAGTDRDGAKGDAGLCSGVPAGDLSESPGRSGLCKERAEVDEDRPSG